MEMTGIYTQNKKKDKHFYNKVRKFCNHFT